MEAIRHRYEELGVEGFYTEHGASYRNPHEARIASLVASVCGPLDLVHCLDIACGSGEATLALRAAGAARVTGLDPYTGEAYKARTGSDALPLRFEDIAAGRLQADGYTLGVCSFALHLCATSYLPVVAQQMSLVLPSLVLLSPHKRPRLLPEWGWELVGERVEDRVHCWHYGSLWVK